MKGRVINFYLIQNKYLFKALFTVYNPDDQAENLNLKFLISSKLSTVYHGWSRLCFDW